MKYVSMHMNLLNMILFFSANLSSDPAEPLKIYVSHYEKPYREASVQYYEKAAQEYQTNNGIVSYMKWADEKLKEEQRRAERYLETREECKFSEELDG